MLSDKYQKLFLKDVDFVVETVDKFLLIEYKNSTIPGAINPDAFENKIRTGEHYIEIARKYYDTIIYLMSCNKNKKYEYIYILECKTADSVIRKLVTSKIMKQLPFDLQKDPDIKHELISSFVVMNIDEWNISYGNSFPIAKMK